MASVIPGEVVGCANPELDIFIRIQGQLVDVNVLEFQIFEKVSGPLANQVFPATEGARQSVALQQCPTGQRISLGNYAASWTVPAGSLFGTYEIRWYFKYLVTSAEQFFFEEFEVLEPTQPSQTDTYITVGDVRAAGLLDPPTDAEVQLSIILWQEVIERMCRQFFRPIEMELNLDGENSDALHLPVAIITLEEMKINRETTVLDAAKYRVYSDKTYLTDDRRNPRIKLVDEYAQARDIYNAPSSYARSTFLKGRQNQYLKGTFGFVEPDGSAPQAIQRALLKLVVEKLTNPVIPGTAGDNIPVQGPLGPIVDTWTDKQRIKYGQAGGVLKVRQPGWSGITNDQEILDLIRMYRSPIGIAAPYAPSFVR